MTTAWNAGTVPEFGLSDRLRKAREHAGMSIEDFAKHIGKSRNTISNYESADYSKKRQGSTIKLWAVGSGVSYDWIQTGNDPRPGGPDEGHAEGAVTERYYPVRLVSSLTAA